MSVLTDVNGYCNYFVNQTVSDPETMAGSAILKAVQRSGKIKMAWLQDTLTRESLETPRHDRFFTLKSKKMSTKTQKTCSSFVCNYSVSRCYFF